MDTENFTEKLVVCKDCLTSALMRYFKYTLITLIVISLGEKSLTLLKEVINFFK